jgi:hypothetical protein
MDVSPPSDPFSVVALLTRFLMFSSSFKSPIRRLRQVIDQMRHSLSCFVVLIARMGTQLRSSAFTDDFISSVCTDPAKLWEPRSPNDILRRVQMYLPPPIFNNP